MKTKITFLLLFLTVSCSYKSGKGAILERSEFKKTEAIKVHDELMAQMGELRSLEKKLLVVLLNNDSLDRNDSIEIAIKRVEAADKSMWDWMHDFDVAYVADTDSLTFIYFDSKLESIQHVKMLFDSAIYKSLKLVE